MNRAELVNLFLKYEITNNLTTNLYWQYARMEVFRYIEDDIFETLCVPIYIRQDLDNINLPNVEQLRHNSIMVINSKNRWVKMGEKEFCPVTSGIKESFSSECTEISFDFSDGAVFIDERKCQSEKVQLNIDTFTIDQNFLNSIVDTFKIKNYDEFSTRIFHLYKYIHTILSFKEKIDKILEVSTTKILIVNGAYNPFFRLFIECANLKKIVTCEMQHGYIHKCHIAYNTLDQSDLAMKSNPKYLAIYTDDVKRNGRFFQTLDHIIVAGNYCCHQAKKIVSNDLKYDYLFVSATNSEVVKKYAISLSIFAPQLKILYRFHPEEVVTDDYVKQLHNHGICCELAKERSVFESLAECQNVVTYNSTVTFEAIEMNKKVFVITDELIRIDPDVVGQVIEVQTPNEFVLSLNKECAIDSVHVPIDDYTNMIHDLIKRLKGDVQ